METKKATSGMKAQLKSLKVTSNKWEKTFNKWAKEVEKEDADKAEYLRGSAKILHNCFNSLDELEKLNSKTPKKKKGVVVNGSI